MSPRARPLHLAIDRSARRRSLAICSKGSTGACRGLEVMSKSVDELITSVNEAAQTVSGLLISLTLAAATLVAVVFAATDDAILRDSLSIVPQLGLSVPLSTITRVAPPFFVLLHAVALLQLNLPDSRINRLRTAAKDGHAEVGRNNYRDRLAGIAFFRSAPNDKGVGANIVQA